MVVEMSFFSTMRGRMVVEMSLFPTKGGRMLVKMSLVPTAEGRMSALIASTASFCIYLVQRKVQKRPICTFQ